MNILLASLALVIAGALTKWNDNKIDETNSSSYVFAVLILVLLAYGVYEFRAGDAALGVLLGLLLTGKIDHPSHWISVLPLFFLFSGNITAVLIFTVASFLDEHEIVGRWFSRLAALFYAPIAPQYLTALLLFDVGYNLAALVWRILNASRTEH